MNTSAILYLSATLGFLITTLLAGKKAGEQGRFKSIILKTKNYRIHIHHWIFSTLGLIMLILLNINNHILVGFLTGTIIQGLTYEDFFKIINKT